MTADGVAPSWSIWRAASGLVNAVELQHPLLPAQPARARGRSPPASSGDVRFVTGHYFQDWLLLDTDWNWRLEPDQGGALRAVGDIGSHWLDLMAFVTGQPIVAVMADLATFVDDAPASRPGRSRRSRPSASADDGRARPMGTEDTADDPAPVRNGARGAVGRLPDQRRPEELAPVRDRRLRRRRAPGTRSTPDQLWIGHRDRPNEILLRNPALMGPAGRAAAALPGGHVEGFGDTFGALFRAVYADVAGGRPDPTRRMPRSPTATTRCSSTTRSRESAATGRWVDVDPRRVGAGHRRRRSGDDAAPRRPLDEARPADRAVPGDAARRTSPTGRPPTGSRGIEIACWPTVDRPDAGATPARRHIDVANLSADAGDEIVGARSRPRA